MAHFKEKDFRPLSPKGKTVVTVAAPDVGRVQVPERDHVTPFVRAWQLRLVGQAEPRRLSPPHL